MESLKARARLRDSEDQRGGEGQLNSQQLQSSAPPFLGFGPTGARPVDVEGSASQRVGPGVWGGGGSAKGREDKLPGRERGYKGSGALGGLGAVLPLGGGCVERSVRGWVENR